MALSLRTKTLRQTIVFSAAPETVYDVLMDAKKHSRLTGSSAQIANRVGGDFSVYDGSVVGRNLELVPGQKIVQRWKIDTEGWPRNHYSLVTFTFFPHEKGTRLRFVQSGIPTPAFKDIKQGWQDYYWRPLKELIKTK